MRAMFEERDAICNFFSVSRATGSKHFVSCRAAKYTFRNHYIFDFLRYPETILTKKLIWLPDSMATSI